VILKTFMSLNQSINSYSRELNTAFADIKAKLKRYKNDIDDAESDDAESDDA